MKRFICLCLAVVKLLGLFSCGVSAEEIDIKVATATVISSEYSYDTCKIYIHNNVCMMDIADVARYTRSTITSNENRITIFHGTRSIDLDLQSGNLTEDNISVTIPTIQHNNLRLIQAYPILSYLGATCDIKDNSIVIDMPEATIWEGTIRSSEENYFTLETFGGEFEQNTRLILNGILKIFETGLSGTLFENSQRDAFINAMQVDPLKYSGGWNVKSSIDEKYGSLASAMISANNFSADFSEFFDNSSDVVSNIIINYLRKTNETDTAFLSELDGLDNLFDISSVASSFISNLSTNAKCTDDSIDMIAAFSNHTLKTGKYYATASLVKKKIQNELSSTIDSAKVAIGGKITSEAVDELYKVVDKSVAGKFKLPQSSYFSVLGLFEESLNISVMLHKLFYGENNAFAYSAAETEAIHLLLLKNELISSMKNLGEQILKENYSNSQHIEEYRLINAFYYRVLIAANEKLEEMIVAQGRESESDMATVINNLHNNNNKFAENLYILTVSTGSSFADVKELSKTNKWDSFEELKANATELNESNNLAMYYLSIQNGQYAISGDYKYLTIQSGNDSMEPTGDLYKENIKTGERTLIKKDTLAQCINVVGDKIFYTQYGGGPYNVGVHMISTDGSGYKKLTDTFVHTLVADETYVYFAIDYTYDQTGGIKRIAYSTETPVEETVISSISGHIYDMNLAQGELVYSEVKTVVDKNTRIVIYDIDAKSKNIINENDNALENFEEMWTHGEYIYILKWHGYSDGQGIESDILNIMKRDLYRYNIATSKYEMCKLPIASYDKLFFSNYCIGDIYSDILADFEEELPTDFSNSSKFKFISVN